MSILSNSAIIGLLGAPGGGYEIERSVRFNSSDSAYLSRTPASAGNRKTWTWAGWVKLSSADRKVLFAQTTNQANQFFVLEHRNNVLDIYDYNGVYNSKLSTSRVFRDYSAWYHVVFTYDTTNSTADDRHRLYVNGEQITSFGSRTNPSQNFEGFVNTAAVHYLSGYTSTGTLPHDGYMAEVHFIDGQSLAASDFGEFDTNGIWQPIEYTGTYGTNGFHLDFSDNSTAAALGTDTSGNGNDWTVNNISVLNGNGQYVGSTSGSFYSPFNDPYKVFDGVLASPNGLYVYSNMTGRLTFSAPLSGVIEVYASNGSSSVTDPANEDVIALSDGSTLDVSGVLYTNRDWFSFGSKTNISWIELRHNDTTGQGTFLLGIRVNGVVLIDNKFSAGNDSLVDSPTNGTQTDTGVGGEVVGNYATFSPITTSAEGNATLSNGNLDISGSGGSYTGSFSTIAVNSGKWYWEYTITTLGTRNGSGIIAIDSLAAVNGGAYGIATSANAWMRQTTGAGGGVVSNNSSDVVTGLSGFTANDVCMVAVDIDSGKLWFGKNGTWDSSGNPATGVNPTVTFTPGGKSYYPCVDAYNTWAGTISFGQRPFAYTAPSGYKALCTANLPTPTIEKGSDYFDTTLYTGNGSTQTISGLDWPGGPDLVWIKNMSAANAHGLFDTIRNATYQLNSNSNAAESVDVDKLTAFTSTGFSVGDSPGVNASGNAYAAWCWDAGTTTDPSNEDGSITSTVRANASAGFSIVTYTGNGTAGATVGHGLGVAPEMIIVKNRDQADAWQVYHAANTANPETDYLVLNTTAATADALDRWNDTAPGASVFTLGDGAEVNTNTEDYVAYCFTGVSGYSSFGSYTGNNNADGPFVFTGHRPAYVLIKNTTDSNGNWIIYDNKRGEYNLNSKKLGANRADEENNTSFYGGDTFGMDFLSNGFKIRCTGANHNNSGSVYVYAAFAESPFQYARAR